MIGGFKLLLNFIIKLYSALAALVVPYKHTEIQKCTCEVTLRCHQDHAKDINIYKYIYTCVYQLWCLVVMIHQKYRHIFISRLLTFNI